MVICFYIIWEFFCVCFFRCMFHEITATKLNQETEQLAYPSEYFGRIMVKCFYTIKCVISRELY